MKRILRDRFCKNRIIVYFRDTVQVYYKHEWSVIAPLFSLSCLFPKVFQFKNSLKNLLEGRYGSPFSFTESIKSILNNIVGKSFSWHKEIRSFAEILGLSYESQASFVNDFSWQNEFTFICGTLGLEKMERFSTSLENELGTLSEILYIRQLLDTGQQLADSSIFITSRVPVHPMGFAVSLTGALFLCSFHQTAMALPTGYQSVSGNVQFSQSGNTLNVTTQANRSIASYQTFNIAQNETVNFVLPSSSSVILNEILGQSPSQIFGHLNSNGQVFLENGSGIIFGSTAQVNVGALNASTLNINNNDFLNGNYIFTQNPSQGAASVINRGSITAAPGGYVVLSGANVQNAGNIYAPGGTVDLAVGEQVSMTVAPGLAVNVTVDKALQNQVQGVNEAITNSGTISAQNVQLQANLANNLYERAINNTGIIEATGFGDENGGTVALESNTDNGAIVQNGEPSMSAVRGLKVETSP